MSTPQQDYANRLKAWLKREAELRAENERLRAALQGLMDMVSNGSLVRPVDRDAEAGWTMRQLPLVMALKAADDVLDATKRRAPEYPPSGSKP